MITRHNYEEYFILYLDRELDAATSREVEAFAAQHPDLQAELDLLLQTRLQPDMDISFAGKENLLRSGATTEINAGNYEEWFFLYIDNELTPQQRLDVEAWITDKPGYAAELQVLQHTRLQPDTSIVFPDKQSLYRTETRVRAIFWRRIAIAASLIFAIGTGTWMLIRDEADQQNGGSMAVTNPPVEQSKTTRPAGSTENSSSGQSSAGTENTAQPENPINTTIADPAKSTDASTAFYQPSSTNDIHRNTNNAGKIKPSEDLNNTSEDAVTAAINTNETAEDVFIRPVAPESAPLTFSKEIKPVAAVTPANIQPLDNRIADGNAANEEDAEPAKKNKLRGFFRKVTRTFERTTNIKATDSDDRLLIGGVAIRL
ncbi:MAG: hypothetical protein J0H92_19185 [Sphingobacteriales bacterium]|nr:hypothetical protein [Sphingobacteriales bacterium]OJW31741.1 MAG: hypothetical protein BGO54_14955 [Sphingobacteriales bacterium 46-32]